MVFIFFYESPVHDLSVQLLYTFCKKYLDIADGRVQGTSHISLKQRQRNSPPQCSEFHGDVELFALKITKASSITGNHTL